MLTRSYSRLGVALSLLLLASLACNVFGPAPTPTPAIPPTPVPSPTPLPPIATISPTPAAIEYTPKFEAAECAFEIPAGAVVECGFLIVPEDRVGDVTDTIRLSVARYRSASATSTTAPILFLQGGPGSGAVMWSAGYYETFIRPLITRRDFIVFDQRGTGLSEPALNCGEVALVYLQDLHKNFSNQDRVGLYADALQKCHDRLVDEGANLSAYTTIASARDVSDLTQALGYTQVNLYGMSYGTRLAQTIMRDHPALVRSAVLDSVLPLEVKTYNNVAANADYALKALFATCAAHQECQTAYPNIEADFWSLVKQLDTMPITVTVAGPLGALPVTVSGRSLINTTIWALHSSFLIPLLPQAIEGIRSGDTEALEYALALPLESNSRLSIGLLASINCHEQVFATTPDELAADLAAFPLTEAYGLSAAYGSKDALFDICNFWKAAPLDDDDRRSLTSAIPTLILAGEFDPTTPQSYGEQLSNQIEQDYFFSFPGQGHTPSVSAQSECPLTIVRAFLDSPTHAPDASCIQTMNAWEFIVPLTGKSPIEFESFTNAEMGLTGLIPHGWTDIGVGFYNRNQSFLDHTQIGVQSDPVSAIIWLDWLNDNFAGTGLDAPPVDAGEQTINGRTWKFYTATFRSRPVDLAFTESGSRTWLVAIVSSANEHDALYTAIFLPVIAAVEATQ